MNEKKLQKIMQDLENNHNWSWFEEIYSRNKSNLSKIALLYRGKKITYDEMFDHMLEYAKSLRTLGITKDMEIPLCLANTPEFVYMLGAISLIGAKANIFGEGFDKEYIKEIISGCNSDVLFVTDNKYNEIKSAIKEAGVKKIVMFSLNDSLPNKQNPYIEFDREYYDFENKVEEFKKENNSIISQNEFKELGKNYSGQVKFDSTLNDEFTITYSSGITNSSRPKGIIHTNRSYITMGRFHDKDASDTRPMKNMTVLASIPTFSNTNVASNISDTLVQGCTVGLEPIFDKNHFIYSLLINKPNFVVTSKSFILYTMKKIKDRQDIKLPFLMALFAAGEPTSPGEEKFINKVLKKKEAGVDVLPKPLAPVSLSIAGGDCEHGGFYFNLFKKINDMNPIYKVRNETSGVKPFSMVEFAILDSNGNHLGKYQVGKLVANSPCSMKEYKNNPEGNKQFFIKDKNGKTYGNCNVFAYEDCLGRLHIKGRYVEDSVLPTYVISDCISKDTKKIMSCEVVQIYDGDNVRYVAHIEFQPDASVNVANVLSGIEKRIKSEIPYFDTENLCYEIHNDEIEFPLTKCGKRNSNELIDEGINEYCLKPIEENGEVTLIAYPEYLKMKNSKKYFMKKSSNI